MQTIPAGIGKQYSAALKKRAIHVSRHAGYRKWLRYYLDFRGKYPLPDSMPELLAQFEAEKKSIPCRQQKARSPEFQVQGQTGRERPGPFNGRRGSSWDRRLQAGHWFFKGRAEELVVRKVEEALAACK